MVFLSQIEEEINVLVDKKTNIRFVFILFITLPYISDAYHDAGNNNEVENERKDIDENELVFLKGLLDSPAVTQLIKVSNVLCSIL